MKHFSTAFWKSALAPRRTLGTVIDGFARITAPVATPRPGAVTYDLAPQFVRTFAMSGHPFLTFYEFNDLAGWYRDTYFAPEHVTDYKRDIGKLYTVWTYEEVSAYRRHIILDTLTEDIRISFEVPSLDTAAWFPLRISIFDASGLYFQTDQRLVIDRIDRDGTKLTSWKKVPALRESLTRLNGALTTG